MEALAVISGQDARAEWPQVARSLSVATNATLVRLGNAAVWETEDGRIVRVDAGASRGLLRMLAAWISLVRADVPLLAPLPMPGGEPFQVVRGRLVTMWPLATPVAQVDFDWDWLGHAISSIHTSSVIGLKRSIPYNIVEISLAALAKTGRYPDSIRPLRARLDSLQETIEWTRHSLSVTHGDAHPGNVVRTEAGLRLVDFESMGTSSKLWDLMAIALLGRRYGVPDESVAGAFEAYGRDPTLDSRFEQMLSLREMLDGIAVARRAEIDPIVRPEADKRITDLVTDRQTVWVSVHPGNVAELKRRGIEVDKAIALGMAGDVALL